MVDKKKFEEQGYNIQIIGRNIHVTEAMKNHALDKLAKIERFQNHIMDVHVTLDAQRLEHSCLILVKFDHITIRGHAIASDMYVAIDQAVDRLQKQLRRWKEKILDLTRKKISIGQMQVNILMSPTIEDEFSKDMEIELEEERQRKLSPGKVVGQEELPLKTLTSDEAVMKMELSGEHFLVFRSEEDNKLKVIYRRDDGNYGLIKPE